jgi:hypothetical protein
MVSQGALRADAAQVRRAARPVGGVGRRGAISGGLARELAASVGNRALARHIARERSVGVSDRRIAARLAAPRVGLQRSCSQPVGDDLNTEDISEVLDQWRVDEFGVRYVIERAYQTYLEAFAPPPQVAAAPAYAQRGDESPMGSPPGSPAGYSVAESPPGSPLGSPHASPVWGGGTYDTGPPADLNQYGTFLFMKRARQLHRATAVGSIQAGGVTPACPLDCRAAQPRT